MGSLATRANQTPAERVGVALGNAVGASVGVGAALRGRAVGKGVLLAVHAATAEARTITSANRSRITQQLYSTRQGTHVQSGSHRGLPMLTIKGDVPTAHDAESVQFARVIASLTQHANRVGEWGYLLLDHGFSHKRGDVIDADQDWNGQIDILLLAPHKIVIYELKGFTAAIKHVTSGPGRWTIQRAASGEEEQVRSYFLQASKQRAFLLRDFLRSFERSHPQYADNHWMVDARVVFKEGSDLSGFFYSVPNTETEEKLETDVISNLNDEGSKAFVRSAYSDREPGTNKLQRIRPTQLELDRMQRIYAENGIMPRTSKWFKVITEEQIPGDLEEVGSDRFTLDPEGAGLLMDDLASTAWVYDPFQKTS